MYISLEWYLNTESGKHALIVTVIKINSAVSG